MRRGPRWSQNEGGPRAHAAGTLVVPKRRRPPRPCAGGPNANTHHKYTHCTLLGGQFGRTGDKEVHLNDQWYQMCPWSPIAAVPYKWAPSSDTAGTSGALSSTKDVWKKRMVVGRAQWASLVVGCLMVFG